MPDRNLPAKTGATKIQRPMDLDVDASTLRSLAGRDYKPRNLVDFLLSLRTSRIIHAKEAERISIELSMRNRVVAEVLNRNFEVFRDLLTRQADRVREMIKGEVLYGLKDIKLDHADAIADWKIEALQRLTAKLAKAKSSIEDPNLQQQACEAITQVFYKEMQDLFEKLGYD